MRQTIPCDDCPFKEKGCPGSRKDHELLICLQTQTYAHPELESDIEWFFDTHQN